MHFLLHCRVLNKVSREAAQICSLGVLSGSVGQRG